jgi:adenosylcobinamide-phosphate guanylyltransferase
MCGGKGTRLDAPVEKPRFEVGGRPMVDRVIDALTASRIETVYAVCSPHAPETRRSVPKPRIDAPGEGYVSDLQFALDQVDQPVLTVAADLPLLDGAVIDRVLDAHDGGPVTVCVPATVKRRLGASVETTLDDDDLAPTGLNVVAEGEETRLVIEDRRLAVNVNRRADATLAERLL